MAKQKIKDRAKITQRKLLKKGFLKCEVCGVTATRMLDGHVVCNKHSVTWMTAQRCKK